MSHLPGIQKGQVWSMSCGGHQTVIRLDGFDTATKRFRFHRVDRAGKVTDETGTIDYSTFMSSYSYVSG